MSRCGGDEFVVLCRSTDTAGVDQVRAALAAAFVTPHGLVCLGLSIGTAPGRHGDGAQDIVAAADRHMYGVRTTRRGPVLAHEAVDATPGLRYLLTGRRSRATGLLDVLHARRA